MIVNYLLVRIIDFLSHYVSIGKQFGGSGLDIATIGASICLFVTGVFFLLGSLVPSKKVWPLYYFGALLLSYGTYKYAFGDVVGANLWSWVFLLSFVTVGFNLTKKRPSIILTVKNISIPKIGLEDDVIGINLGMLLHVTYTFYLLYTVFPTIPYALTVTIILLIVSLIVAGKSVPKSGIVFEPLFSATAYSWFFVALYIGKIDQMTYFHLTIFIFALLSVIFFIVDVVKGILTDFLYYKVTPSALIGHGGMLDGLIVIPALVMAFFTFSMPVLSANICGIYYKFALTPVKSDFDFLKFFFLAFLIGGTYIFLVSQIFSIITAPIAFIILVLIMPFKCPELVDNIGFLSLTVSPFIMATIFNYGASKELFICQHEEDVLVEMEILKDLLKKYGENFVIEYIKNSNVMRRLIIELALKRLNMDHLLRRANVQEFFD